MTTNVRSYISPGYSCKQRLLGGIPAGVGTMPESEGCPRGYRAATETQG